MFSQGMCPVFKVVPGHPQWERIKDKPTFIVSSFYKFIKLKNPLA